MRQNSLCVALAVRLEFYTLEFSQEETGKGSYFRERRQYRRREYSPGCSRVRGEGDSCTMRAVQRQIEENKLDTGEDRTSQRMRRRQKIRTDC